MRVSITKRGNRNQLACVRADGTSVVANLGPGLPHHDLAHFVVESRFGLKEGFFGNIARGYSPAQLSDKEIIKRLGSESALAEVLARALGSLSTGACRPEQFEELVNTELSQWSIATIRVSPEVLDAMMAEFNSLLKRYRALREEESMTLEFSCGSGVRAAP